MEKLYCTIFIVDVSQNPEDVDTISSRIQQLIEDHGGIIKKVNPWGKRRLAYPIQRRNYGFYVEIEFTANSRLNIPQIIENEYRLDDRVLRYLTYVVTKKELIQREISAAKLKKEEIIPEPVAEEMLKPEPFEDELELIDEEPEIEKKLPLVTETPIEETLGEVEEKEKPSGGEEEESKEKSDDEQVDAVKTEEEKEEEKK